MERVCRVDARDVSVATDGTLRSVPPRLASPDAPPPPFHRQRLRPLRRGGGAAEGAAEGAADAEDEDEEMGILEAREVDEEAEGGAWQPRVGAKVWSFWQMSKRRKQDAVQRTRWNRKQWYAGRITKFTKSSGTFTVKYNDGDVESGVKPGFMCQREDGDGSADELQAGASGEEEDGDDEEEARPEVEEGSQGRAAKRPLPRHLSQVVEEERDSGQP